MKIKIKTKWYEGEAEIKVGYYLNERKAIRIFTEEGPFCVATVNLPNEMIDDNKVFLKGWSENEGIPEALEKAGVVRLTGRKVVTGFVEALEAELLMELE